MKLYELCTILPFGKYEGKEIYHILQLDSSYIKWCSLNLDHFVLTPNDAEGIDQNKDWKISWDNNEKEILRLKYKKLIALNTRLPDNWCYSNADEMNIYEAFDGDEGAYKEHFE